MKTVVCHLLRASAQEVRKSGTIGPYKSRQFLSQRWEVDL